LKDDSCLKFRQNLFLVLFLGLLVISCGKALPLPGRSDSMMLSEYSCAPEATADLAISKGIATLFFEQRNKFPQAYFFIEPRAYNFENPLVLSVAKMQSDYVSIKADSHIENRSTDLFYLYNYNQRFESQRCQFTALAEKKKFDLRPYLNISHKCFKKFNGQFCDDSEFINMDREKEEWTRGNALDLCLSFSKTISCNQEYKQNKINNTLGAMIRKYYTRFEKERFEALFRLRSTHNRYHCSRSGEKLVMTLRVFAPEIDRVYLQELLDAVETTWTNDKFSLKTVLISSPEKDAITIFPTTKAVSYVPDDDNRRVYLSQSLDMLTSMRILAHEFGHVLGFPDCYIEFFDDKKKELVYYEISKNYTNIMCSLKNGVRVPEDYFTQLEQNSCIFN